MSREISLIDFVSSQMPPTLIIYGEADDTVPIQQAKRFLEKAKTAGVTKTKRIVRPGKGHGWGDYWKSTEDTTAFADWFDEHLKTIKD